MAPGPSALAGRGRHSDAARRARAPVGGRAALRCPHRPAAWNRRRHSGRGALLAINVAGIGRAIPSLAILALVLPLAATLIVDGIGTAAVTIVATAPLGALVASGGLGRYLVALLAIVTQIGFGALARLVAPRTSRSTPTSPDLAP